jgi:3-oxoacyl-[acyl-carrier protein] reductase
VNLEGKNVLITGSTQGIGLRIAKKFSEVGANVAINGLPEVPDKILAEVAKEMVKVIAVAGDVYDEVAAKEMIAKVEAEFGSVDILVNNAGITNDKLTLRMSKDDFERVIRVNLTGTFNMTSAALKGMVKRRSGVIINISSVVGLIGNIGQANYAASKAGVIGLTKSVAREVAQRGIRVNAIAPGFIKTKMTDALNEKVKEMMLCQIPMKKFGETDDIAQVALFLAEADYLTGQVINVDGGLVMNG